MSKMTPITGLWSEEAKTTTSTLALTGEQKEGRTKGLGFFWKHTRHSPLGSLQQGARARVRVSDISLTLR